MSSQLCSDEKVESVCSVEPSAQPNSSTSTFTLRKRVYNRKTGWCTYSASAALLTDAQDIKDALTACARPQEAHLSHPPLPASFGRCCLCLAHEIHVQGIREQEAALYSSPRKDRPSPLTSERLDIKISTIHVAGLSRQLRELRLSVSIDAHEVAAADLHWCNHSTVTASHDLRFSAALGEKVLVTIVEQRVFVGKHAEVRIAIHELEVHQYLDPPEQRAATIWEAVETPPIVAQGGLPVMLGLRVACHCPQQMQVGLRHEMQVPRGKTVACKWRDGGFCEGKPQRQHDPGMAVLE